MFDVLVSLGVGVFFVLLFFFFTATSPTKESPTLRSRSSSSASSSSPTSGKDRESSATRGAPESVRWLGVVLQFVAWTVLGRGGGDPACWNATIAHHLDKLLQRVLSNARCKLRCSTTPRLQLISLVCGTFQEGTTPAQSKSLRGGSAFSSAISSSQTLPPASPAILTSHSGGTILPTIGAVSSREYLCGKSGRTVREFRVPITYADNAFKMSLRGELPLMFGFGGSSAASPGVTSASGGGLRIPIDLITTKTSMMVTRIDLSCEALLVATHNSCEIFFESSPAFTATFAVSLGGRTSVLSEPKLAEVCLNAVRLALSDLVFPKCMRMTISSEKPYLRWSKGVCEERTAASP